jgi:hypothetical protein
LVELGLGVQLSQVSLDLVGPRPREVVVGQIQVNLARSGEARGLAHGLQLFLGLLGGCLGVFVEVAAVSVFVPEGGLELLLVLGESVDDSFVELAEFEGLFGGEDGLGLLAG